jgi:hypothetical protein
LPDGEITQQNFGLFYGRFILATSPFRAFANSSSIRPFQLLFD